MPSRDGNFGGRRSAKAAWQLDGLGIRTGIDLKKLVETSVRLAGRLGRPSPSAVVRALQAPV